jgi:hypothetical protein
LARYYLTNIKIKELIHKGAYAEIYNAWDQERGVDVAIKLFAADDPQVSIFVEQITSNKLYRFSFKLSQYVFV